MKKSKKKKEMKEYDDKIEMSYTEEKKKNNNIKPKKFGISASQFRLNEWLAYIGKRGGVIENHVGCPFKWQI